MSLPPYPPVETELGEQVRPTGLRILTARFEVLLDRSRRRALLPRDREEFAATADAIEQLQRMAPVAPLEKAGRNSLALDAADELKEPPG